MSLEYIGYLRLYTNMTALSKITLMLLLMKFLIMTTLIAFVQTVHNSFKGNISINPSQWFAEVLQQ